jgi:hypothetical protein
MRSMMIRASLWLYPSRWRERYADEVSALLEDSGGGIGDVVDVALGGLRQRIHQLQGGGVMSDRAKYWLAVAGGVLAILVVMPTAVFIGLSVFYPGVEFKGIEWPLGIQLAPHVNWLIPLLPAVALLIALVPVVRIGVRRGESGGAMVTARILPVPWPLLIAIAVCASVLGVVVAYGISENLLEALR